MIQPQRRYERTRTGSGSPTQEALRPQSRRRALAPMTTTPAPPASSAPSSGPRLPEPGQVVRVRTRTYLVGPVEKQPNGSGTLVRLACLDDDAQGQPLEVAWELELAPEVLDPEAWQSIGKRGFDNSCHFSAYIHTLRWNCVTATGPRFFQAPFRAVKWLANVEGDLKREPDRVRQSYQVATFRIEPVGLACLRPLTG